MQGAQELRGKGGQVAFAGLGRAGAHWGFRISGSEFRICGAEFLGLGGRASGVGWADVEGSG